MLPDKVIEWMTLLCSPMSAPGGKVAQCTSSIRYTNENAKIRNSKRYLFVALNISCLPEPSFLDNGVIKLKFKY